ncbi:MAG: ABC-type transport auxiliary lipoprotein family protein, partial [Candidatus Binatia bacterium]
MKTATGKRAALGTLLMLSLWGCVSVNMERDYLPRRYFVLNATGDSIAPQANGAGVLKLADVRVSSRYDGKGFVYRIAPQNFETDFYNQFLVAPGSMITDELREALRRANLFQYILNSASAAEPTHLLEATVEELYGDFSSDTAGRAVLAVSFVMSREPTTKPQVVFQKQYEKSIPLQARSAEALVQGWNRALEEILG